MAVAALVVGDVHHPEDGGSFVAFLDGLREQPPIRLIILGDLLERWFEDEADVRSHAALFTRLHGLAARGWQIAVIPGNREFLAGPVLRAACAGSLHWPALDLIIGGRAIRIVHGDRLVRDRGYRLLAAWMRSFWMRASAAAAVGGLRRVVGALMRRRSRGHRQARRIGGSLRGLDPRRLAGTARGRDVLIAGHIHQRCQRHLGRFDFALVGDWSAAGGSWIAIHDDGRVESPCSR